MMNGKYCSTTGVPLYRGCCSAVGAVPERGRSGTSVTARAGGRGGTRTAAACRVARQRVGVYAPFVGGDDAPGSEDAPLPPPDTPPTPPPPPASTASARAARASAPAACPASRSASAALCRHVP